MILGACVGGSLPREKAEAEFAPFRVKLVERGPRLEKHRDPAAALDRGSRQPPGRLLPVPRPDARAEAGPEAVPPDLDRDQSQPELTRSHVTDRALRRVGLMADGWMTDNTPVDRFKERWALIRQIAREAGRSTEPMESALHLMVNINDDQPAAFEESVKFLQTYYSPR